MVRKLAAASHALAIAGAGWVHEGTAAAAETPRAATEAAALPAATPAVVGATKTAVGAAAAAAAAAMPTAARPVTGYPCLENAVPGAPFAQTRRPNHPLLAWRR